MVMRLVIWAILYGREYFVRRFINLRIINYIMQIGSSKSGKTALLNYLARFSSTVNTNDAML